MKKRSLFLRALSSSNSEGRPPIWLMRQSGRYLPRYRALRKKYAFETICHDPELIVEATLLPLAYFDFDAAILFSDILIVAEALGVQLHFEESLGPVIDTPVRSPNDVYRLQRRSAAECFPFIRTAIQELNRRLDIPLIGFAGAPFTLASYLIEPPGEQGLLARTKHWLYSDIKTFCELLDRITEAVISLLILQIEAGVDAIQLFDTWAGALPHHQFCQLSLHYLRKIIQAVKPYGVPVTVFCRNASNYFPLLAASGATAVSLDWGAHLPALRQAVGSEIVLQGNLDPEILLTDRHVVAREVERMVAPLIADPGYIVNLGHGVLPATSLDAIHGLIESVHKLSDVAVRAR